MVNCDKSAIIAAELYVPREGGRPRCGDVQSALADAAKRDTLALAPFDIIELDGQPFVAAHYDEVYAKLTELFSLVSVTENDGRKLKMTKSSSFCRPVEMRTAASVDEVQQISVSAVELDAVDACLLAAQRAVSELSYQLVDLIDSHRACLLHGDLAHSVRSRNAWLSSDQ